MPSQSQTFQQKSFSAWQIAWSTLVGLFVKNTQVTESDLPPQINDFQLVKRLFPERVHRSFIFGLYKNAEGKEAIAKIWKGEHQNFDYFSLMNEMGIYQLIDSMGLSDKDNVITPKLYAAKVEAHLLILLIEKMSFKTLDGLSVSQRVEAYERAIHFLHQHTSSIIENSSYSVSTRSTLSLCTAFPIVWLKSLLNSPHHRSLILKSGLVFMQNIIPFLTAKEKTFVHRSLENSNILTNGKQLCLIDFQLSVFAHPLFELSQICYFGWKDQEFCQAFLASKTVQSMLAGKHQQEIFANISIFTSLHQLSEGISSRKNALDLLKFVTNKNGDEPSIQVGLPEKFYFFGLKCLYFFNAAFNFLSLQKPKGKFVLCYHSIGNSAWRFTTPAETFAQQIKYLTSVGKIVPLAELEHHSQTAFAITFDDAYADVVENALPVLKKANATATVFALSKPEDAHIDQLRNSLQFATTSELKKLLQAGWEIGSHTATHPDLRACTDETLAEELAGSKKTLEKSLETQVRFFAYPRGIYSSKIESAVKDAGYTAAFTVDGGSYTTQHPYLIPRVPIEGNTDMKVFIAMLSPLGQLLTKLFMFVLQKKEALQHAVLK